MQRKPTEAENKQNLVKLKQLLQIPGNEICADCASAASEWASVNLGVFICLRCSGLHRQLGTHISKVRSVRLDSWQPDQLLQMELVGNLTAQQIYEKGMKKSCRRAANQSDQSMFQFIRDKYENKRWYNRSKKKKKDKKQKSEKAEGDQKVKKKKKKKEKEKKKEKTPEPSSSSELSESSDDDLFAEDMTNSQKTTGIEALPGESEHDYAARQQREQAAARARMQAKFGNSGLSGLGSNSPMGSHRSYSAGAPNKPSLSSFLSDESDSSDEDYSSSDSEEAFGRTTGNGSSLGGKSEAELNAALERLRKMQDNCACPNCEAVDDMGFRQVSVMFGTFVCSNCKAAHQAFSHRVKSVGMSTFSAEEVSRAQTVGNALARATWLGRLRRKDIRRKCPTSQSRPEEWHAWIKRIYIDKEFYCKPESSKTSRKEAPVKQKKGSQSAKSKPKKVELSESSELSDSSSQEDLEDLLVGFSTSVAVPKNTPSTTLKPSGSGMNLSAFFADTTVQDSDSNSDSDSDSSPPAVAAPAANRSESLTTPVVDVEDLLTPKHVMEKQQDEKKDNIMSMFEQSTTAKNMGGMSFNHLYK